MLPNQHINLYSKNIRITELVKLSTSVEPPYKEVRYNTRLFSWSQLFVFLTFYPDMMRNLIKQGNFHGPEVPVIMKFHCSSNLERIY